MFLFLAIWRTPTWAVTFERIPNAHDYINEQEEQLAEEINFTLEWCEAYTMDQRELLNYFKMQGGFVHGAIRVTKHEDKSVDVCLRPHYSPGVRVAYAYRTGDTSFLTSEERSLYEYCLKIANDAYLASNSALEREKYIHDFICKHVVYKDDDTVDRTTSVPRFETAIGAFFDGEANCQGYTDLFYLLATMTGFEVRKQIGGDWNWKDQSDNNHIWNAIKLDGKWYEVDVTWDDLDNSDTLYYAYFNFSNDMLHDHNLSFWGYCASIALSTDQHFFYYSELGVSASDYAELAQKIYSYKCNHPNETQVYAMYTGGQWDYNTFGNALQSYVDQLQIGCNYMSYKVSYDSPKQDIFFVNLTWNE